MAHKSVASASPIYFFKFLLLNKNLVQNKYVSMRVCYMFKILGKIRMRTRGRVNWIWLLVTFLLLLVPSTVEHEAKQRVHTNVRTPYYVSEINKLVQIKTVH
jgi:hypothetical protein